MAHFIAEKIAEVEAASGQDRLEKGRACADEILKVWLHRRSFPDGSRPLEEYDEILKTLDTLNLNESQPRYFPGFNDSDAPAQSEAAIWLRKAERIDSAAQILIRYSIATAVKISQAGGVPLLEAAAQCAGPDDVDLQVIFRLAQDSELFKRPDPVEAERLDLQKMLLKLQEFEAIATGVRADLEERLGALSAGGSDPRQTSQPVPADPPGES